MQCTCRLHWYSNIWSECSSGVFLAAVHGALVHVCTMHWSQNPLIYTWTRYHCTSLRAPDTALQPKLHHGADCTVHGAVMCGRLSVIPVYFGSTAKCSDDVWSSKCNWQKPRFFPLPTLVWTHHQAIKLLLLHLLIENS